MKPNIAVIHPNRTITNAIANIVPSNCSVASVKFQLSEVLNYRILNILQYMRIENDKIMDFIVMLCV